MSEMISLLSGAGDVIIFLAMLEILDRKQKAYQ